MNDFSLATARWLGDFYLSTTVLLLAVLLVGRWIAQPARRLALAWSATGALIGLALLCALPDWSSIHLLSQSSVPTTVEATPQSVVPLPISRQQDETAREPSTLSLPNVEAVPHAAVEIRPIDWGRLATLTIAGGGVVVLAWLGLGAWQIRRLCASATAPPENITRLFDEFAAAGLELPRLGVSDRLAVPVATGLWQPMILLPAALVERAKPSELRTVLAHELAHVRHRDLWLLAALRMLLVVLWAHPLFWLLRRRVRLDQEMLADAAAAEVSDRHRYAEQLVAWARVATEVRTPRIASSVGLWESASQLKQRVRTLLDEKLTILRASSRRWRLGTAICLAIIAVGLSLVSLTPADTLVAAVEAEKDTEKTPSADEEKRESDGQRDRFAVPSPPTDDDNGEKSITQSTAKPMAATTANDRRQALNKLLTHLYQNKKPNTFQAVCLDENWQPLAGILVEVYLDNRDESEVKGRPILVAKSNPHGEIDLTNVIDLKKEFPDGLPSGRFFSRKSKLVRFVGFAEGRVAQYGADYVSELAKNGKVEMWVFRPASTLRGHVTDPAGQPVVGAKVMTGAAGVLVGNVGGIHSATTDANGEYEIADLDAFEAEDSRRAMAETMKADPDTRRTLYSSSDPRGALFVKHPKFATRRAAIEKIPGNVDVRLVPASTIEGRITLPAGEAQQNPVVGTAVHLQRVVPLPKSGEYPDPFSFQIETAKVDQDGRYQFTSLPAGKYDLTADVDGWVTQGIENVEVAVGETATAPDILLTSGGRVRVQLVDEETGEPMRFEKPTKGYINPQQHPQRTAIFLFQNNVVEFSTNGVAEIQIPAGDYSILATVPVSQGTSLVSAEMLGDRDKWPVFQLQEGELLEVSTRLKAWERPKARLEHSSTSTSPANDEESNDVSVEGVVIPKTPLSETGNE